ncbi:restriction endonuclease subunit S [Burkholderia sp. BDU5]|uniref:restriction endonuclease subunit S n=1 Tax=Burkholderia sp. BDU5 TaxID=1385590 RepID=UPI0007568F56|nr:restriction endonuclease subunit S [Burkholderia sp. BDU5]
MNKESDVKQAVMPRLRFPEFRDAGGWKSEFGDKVFDQVSNKDHNSDLPVLAITQEHGAIPRNLIDYHVSVADKSIEGYKVVEAGDFIISLRSFQGGIEYSKYQGICSPAYVVLRLQHGHAANYFRQLLKTDRFITQLNKNLEGLRDGKMVSYKQFSELPLPVPSQPEQQKIADCLSSLDELVAAENQKLDALKTQKKGLMQQLFPREGEAAPRLRLPEFQNAGEWKVKVLSEIATIRSGTTPLRSEPKFYNGGTIPWVKTTDLNNSFIARTEECITHAAKAKINPVDSVLVAMYGGFNQIGRTGFLTMPAATNQAISVLNPKKDEVLPIYLLTWLNAKVDYWKKIASSSRKDSNITSSDVANFPICYPGTKEQEELANLFSSLDDLIAIRSQKIDALKAHKKGLMQRLFPVLDEVQG